MPDIRPFRGVLYNPRKIEDITRVVTEPYDVINPVQQQAYYETHPYNIIRLILGKRQPQDTNKNNRYTRAGKYFADWLRKDILLRDEKESIYIYSQCFLHNNRKKTRTGFIVLLKLEDFTKSAVLPHENTFSQPVEDRLKLLKIVRANLSPIFALFCDPQGKINKLLSQYKRAHRPYIVIEKNGVLHRIWRMSDKKKILLIKKLFKKRQVFIADGHHRYKAALDYKIALQRAQKRPEQNAPYNYVMTYLVPTTDPGLAILSTHRLIRNIADFNPRKIIQRLRKSFKICQFSTSFELFSYLRHSQARCIFGTYFKKNFFYGLKLKAPKHIYPALARKGGVYQSIDQNKDSLCADLGVSILHSFIIEDILKLAPLPEDIYYTRDVQEAIKLVDQKDYQVAFFLKPATITQVKRVAKAGERMPHKSTYFYPKLLTGLVINMFS